MAQLLDFAQLLTFVNSLFCTRSQTKICILGGIETKCASTFYGSGRGINNAIVRTLDRELTIVCVLPDQLLREIGGIITFTFHPFLVHLCSTIKLQKKKNGICILILLLHSFNLH